MFLFRPACPRYSMSDSAVLLRCACRHFTNGLRPHSTVLILFGGSQKDRSGIMDATYSTYNLNRS